MSASEESVNLTSVLKDLERLKHRKVAQSGLDPQLALLRAWQSRRLARTYADLQAHPRYRPACEFFLDDIYGPRDFSQRDHDIEQMYAFMRRVFPEPMIRPLKLTVEVHRMTSTFDAKLLDVLIKQLNMQDSLTEDMYAEGYRLCDNYVERVKQIEQIYKIGSLLDEVMHHPLTGTTLAIAKGPARRAGWNELTDFIEHGYDAFKHMRGAEKFIKTIRQREKLILDRIYSHEPNPFDIPITPIE